MNKVTTLVKEPYAFITKRKQRIKQYNNVVYLNNGDEFEIELFNPTTNKILAEIELNGNTLGNGIVLRPGERVFLERYFDNNKKFKFITYEVNGNNREVIESIKNNGNVRVKFYLEDFLWTNYMDTYYNYISPTVLNGNFFTQDTSLSDNLQNFDYNVASASTPTSPSTYINKKESSIETGRVEKGSESSQDFTYDNSRFQLFFSYVSEWKILPLSRKTVTYKDINNVWCTNCGAKRKKTSHKFCPICGTKYE